jgi:hypothetical protein
LTEAPGSAKLPRMKIREEITLKIDKSMARGDECCLVSFLI